MAYEGQDVVIPLGGLGLRTDDAQTSLPKETLIEANNIDLVVNQAEKCTGGAKLNSVALESGLVALHDWWPTPSQQRTIALTRSGKVWRDSDGNQEFSRSSNVMASHTNDFDSHGHVTNLTDQRSFSFTPSQDNILYSAGFYIGTSALPTTITGNMIAYLWGDDGTKKPMLPVLGTSDITAKGTLGDTTSEFIEFLFPNGPRLIGGLTYHISITGYDLVFPAGEQLNIQTALTNTGAERLNFTSNGGASWNQGGATTSIGFIYTGYANTEYIASLSSSPTVSTIFSEGGLEAANRNRKLFIYTGSNQVQVLSGDGTTLAPIATPAADWTTYFPTFGLIHRIRHAALGNSNNPHMLYLSTGGEHEDFVTDPLLFNVYPGEGDRLIAAGVFQGRLFMFKAPFGVYYLEDTDPNPVNWFVKRTNTSFGLGSNHALANTLKDYLMANSTGSVTSLEATEKLGNVEAADTMALLKVEDYIRAQMDPQGTTATHAIYYSEKKQAMFTMKSREGTLQDRIFIIDLNKPQPRCYLYTKDQPNCLTLRQDSDKISRPMYGSEDGFIYQMDNPNLQVGTTAYEATLQTPHMDFGFVDSSLASKNKLFDFLELVFEPTGGWDVDVEVYIDDELVETISYLQATGPRLGTFVLDEDPLTADSPQPIRKPLHGSGRRISFRLKQSGLLEGFKIQALVVYFRVSGQQQGGYSAK